MTIDAQANFIAKELQIATATLSGLRSRNAETDQDEERVSGLTAVLKTLSWVRDNAETIRKVAKGESA